MLDKLTHDLMANYLGQVFLLSAPAGELLPLELIQVDTPAPSGYSWRQPEAQPGRRQPFSIVFRGPAAPPLGQGMVTLTHPELGTLEGLFLVPIDADKTYRYYEAVFG